MSYVEGSWIWGISNRHMTFTYQLSASKYFGGMTTSKPVRDCQCYIQLRMDKSDSVINVSEKNWLGDTNYYASSCDETLIGTYCVEKH